MRKLILGIIAFTALSNIVSTQSIIRSNPFNDMEVPAIQLDDALCPHAIIDMQCLYDAYLDYAESVETEIDLVSAYWIGHHADFLLCYTDAHLDFLACEQACNNVPSCILACDGVFQSDINACHLILDAQEQLLMDGLNSAIQGHANDFYTAVLDCCEAGYDWGPSPENMDFTTPDCEPGTALSCFGECSPNTCGSQYQASMLSACNTYEGAVQAAYTIFLFNMQAAEDAYFDAIEDCNGNINCIEDANDSYHNDQQDLVQTFIDDLTLELNYLRDRQETALLNFSRCCDRNCQ